MATIAGLNERNLERAAPRELQRASDLLDDLYLVASHYVPWIIGFNGTSRHPATRLLLTSFHKGLIDLGSSFMLTRKGLYGPARPLMRQAFEAAVIGKFCSISGTRTLHDKWMDGREVRLSRDVFSQISSPSPAPMQRLWRELSGLTHATIYAGQLGLTIRDEEGLRATWLNVCFIVMLAECLYHLFSTHLVTKSAWYFHGFYADKDGARTAASRFKQHLSAAKREMLRPDAVRLTATYRAKWVTRAG